MESSKEIVIPLILGRFNIAVVIELASKKYNLKSDAMKAKRRDTEI